MTEEISRRYIGGRWQTGPRQEADGGSLPAGWTVDDPEAGNLNGNRGAETGTAALNGVQSIDASPDPANPDPTADIAIAAPNGLNICDIVDVNPAGNGGVRVHEDMEFDGGATIRGLPADAEDPDEALSLQAATDIFLTSDALFTDAGALITFADAAGGTVPHEIPAVPTAQHIADALLAVFPTLFTQAA